MAEKEIKHAGSDRVKRSYFDKSRREEYTILIPSYTLQAYHGDIQKIRL